jgi:hypothetical protein
VTASDADPAQTAPQGNLPEPQALSLDTASETVRRLVSVADGVGSVYRKWGVSGTLLIFGTTWSVVSFFLWFNRHEVWTTVEFVTSLTFGFSVLVLGLVAFRGLERASGASHDRAIEWFKVEAQAHREAVSQAEELRRKAGIEVAEASTRARAQEQHTTQSAALPG